MPLSEQLNLKRWFLIHILRKLVPKLGLVKIIHNGISDNKLQDDKSYTHYLLYFNAGSISFQHLLFTGN